jgi:threonine/homoserine efflux transporter RhtA
MDRAKPASPHSSRRLQIKTGVFLVIAVTTGPLGAVFLREGMRHAKLATDWNPVILIQISRMILTNGYVWLGILNRAVSALAVMIVLSWADYSYVVPATSVNYAIAVFLGWAMLGEVVPLGRWVGVVLICVGVAFISKTPARTTEPAKEEGVEGILNARPGP